MVSCSAYTSKLGRILSMVEIRRFLETDNVDDISRIYALSWKKAYRGIIPDDYLNSLSETRWSQRLKKDSDTLFLAVEDGILIGGSTYSPARDKAMEGWGEIISLYLLPSHYHKGIGTELFKTVIGELNRLGFEKIYLWVLEENHSARAFYESKGFTFNGDINIDDIGGKTVKEIRYVFKPDLQ